MCFAWSAVRVFFSSASRSKKGRRGLHFHSIALERPFLFRLLHLICFSFHSIIFSFFFLLDKRGRLRGKHAAAVDIWHIHSNFKPNSKHIKMLFNTFCPAFLKCFVVGSLLGPILIYLLKGAGRKEKIVA